MCWGGAMVIGIHFFLWGSSSRLNSFSHSTSRPTVTTLIHCTYIAHPAHLFD